MFRVVILLCKSRYRKETLNKLNSPDSPGVPSLSIKGVDVLIKW